ARLCAIHLDEPGVVRTDLAGGRGTIERPVHERLERGPPDRTTDREALVSRDAARRLEPAVHRRRVGATPEHHARHMVAPGDAALLDDGLTILPTAEPLH